MKSLSTLANFYLLMFNLFFLIIPTNKWKAKKKKILQSVMMTARQSLSTISADGMNASKSYFVSDCIWTNLNQTNGQRPIWKKKKNSSDAFERL